MPITPEAMYAHLSSLVLKAMGLKPRGYFTRSANKIVSFEENYQNYSVQWINEWTREVSLERPDYAFVVDNQTFSSNNKGLIGHLFSNDSFAVFFLKGWTLIKPLRQPSQPELNYLVTFLIRMIELCSLQLDYGTERYPFYFPLEVLDFINQCKILEISTDKPYFEIFENVCHIRCSDLRWITSHLLNDLRPHETKALNSALEKLLRTVIYLEKKALYEKEDTANLPQKNFFDSTQPVIVANDFFCEPIRKTPYYRTLGGASFIVETAIRALPRDDFFLTSLNKDGIKRISVILAHKLINHELHFPNFNLVGGEGFASAVSCFTRRYRDVFREIVINQIKETLNPPQPALHPQLSRPTHT